MVSVHPIDRSPIRPNSAVAALILTLLAVAFSAADVRAQGTPPTAFDDGDSTESDRSVTIAILANDLGGSFPIDRSSVTILLPPESGTYTVDSETGDVTYTPVPGVATNVSMMYEFSDVTGQTSNPAWVWIVVSHDPPVASDDAEITYSESLVIDVLANDWGGTGALAPGTVQIVNAPSHGSASIDPSTGEVTYTPDTLYVGSDSFDYVVEDEYGVASNVAQVSISVHNDPPTIISFYSWQDSAGTWVFEGMVTDERPDTVTIEFGGVLSGTTTPDSTGYFFTSVDLPPGTYGQGSATAIDDVGQEYGPEFAEIFPY